MACARNIGLSHLPIVCVNVNGYYEPFRTILQRAYEDRLIRVLPDNLVYFCDSALEAMQWVEETLSHPSQSHIQAPPMRKTSVLHTPVTGEAIKRSIEGDATERSVPVKPIVTIMWHHIAIAAIGFGCGVVFMSMKHGRYSKHVR
jgi:hypothetical protein